MATVLKPPTLLGGTDPNKISVFLAGSIEMGKAEDWQVRLESLLSENGVTIFNPRRDNWDPSLEQKASNPEFRGQVEWELDALDMADYIFMYLSPGTISPISLLELGLYASSDKLIVCCPEGFHRKGNVDIVCERHGIPQVGSIEEFVTLFIRETKIQN